MRGRIEVPFTRGCALGVAVSLAVCTSAAPVPGGEEIRDAPPPPQIDAGDVGVIQERGTLRVLVAAGEAPMLRPVGSPRAVERELARELAHRLGVTASFVTVPAHDELLAALIQGRGDLVAAQLTVTESRQRRVSFTRPRYTVDEWLVGRRGAARVPKRPEDLGGMTVSVRASSSYAETLAALKSRVPTLRITPVNETLTTEELLEAVSVGDLPLTVADSHLLDAVESYNPDLVRAFVLASGRQVAWATRRDSPQLKRAADTLLTEHALTADTLDHFDGDLAAIRKRGVLRVLVRNNSVSYMLHRSRPMGFDYEVARMAASAMGVDIEAVVPPTHDDIIPWLREGRGDVIAASFTITDERREQASFTRPYLFVQERVVQPASAEPMEKIGDLHGARVVVRPTSSYARTLASLQASIGPIQLVDASSDLETETLIGMVGRGEIPLTVADSHILDVELALRDDIRAGLPLVLPVHVAEAGDDATLKPIAFATRKTNPELRAFLDRFVKETYRGTEYNIIKKRYFGSPRRIAAREAAMARQDGRISPYDELIKKYAGIYGLDWRLLSAQAFVESRFDPRATSWMGAQGIFQVMPETGRELGFERLYDPEISIHAGAKYMHQLVERWDDTLPFDERMRLALASYNAGYGHVSDARRLAKRRGLDPNRWFGHVDRAMLLLEQPRFYRHARYGYVRGSEPVSYVRQIQSQYQAYVALAPP